MTREDILSGYFDDFLGGKTLLLLGSRLAFLDLANWLGNIAPTGKLDPVQLGISAAKTGFDLRMKFSGTSEGSAVSAQSDSGALVWTMGANTAKTIAQQLRTLADTSGPAHAYLETEGDVQVVASVDEYPASVFFSG